VWGQLNTVVPSGGNGSQQTSLTVPDGGESWVSGTSHDIEWYEHNDITQDWIAYLDYSHDSGTTWTDIATVEGSGPGPQSYAWTVPALIAGSPPIGTFRVRVSTAKWVGYLPVYQAGDGSEADFEIRHDDTPPAPDPMTWAGNPAATGINQASMTATTAGDVHFSVEYSFDAVTSPTSGGGSTDSGWQASTTYVDTGLEANHQYGYRVKARDTSPLPNETEWSDTVYSYTHIEPPTGIAFGTVTESTIALRSANVPSGLDRGSSGLHFTCTQGLSSWESGWRVNNDDWTLGGLVPNTMCSCHAMARNGDGMTTSTSPSSDICTLAAEPAKPTVANHGTNTLDVSLGSDLNPPHTEYAIAMTDSGTGVGYYVDSSGAIGDTPHWRTMSAWASPVTVTGLAPDSFYCVAVIARNLEYFTRFSPSQCESTLPREIFSDDFETGDTDQWSSVAQ
jgi:hypothetical protein